MGIAFSGRNHQGTGGIASAQRTRLSIGRTVLFRDVPRGQRPLSWRCMRRSIRTRRMGGIRPPHRVRFDPADGAHPVGATLTVLPSSRCRRPRSPSRARRRPTRCRPRDGGAGFGRGRGRWGRPSLLQLAVRRVPGAKAAWWRRLSPSRPERSSRSSWAAPAPPAGAATMGPVLRRRVRGGGSGGMGYNTSGPKFWVEAVGVASPA